MKIGILCPSEIAFRRFLPALSKLSGLFRYAGVAVASYEEWFGASPSDSVLQSERSKAVKFQSSYGGDVFESYGALLNSSIECVYIPLPPALHHKWGMRALEQGKHVLMEKPFAASLAETCEMVELARGKSLALHENYMFQYHGQIARITEIMDSGAIGDIRLLRADFGFPIRGSNDFRYDKRLGGGALLDCGGYTVKLASMLLGDDAKIVQAASRGKQGFDVDVNGSGVMQNGKGMVAQLSFGMDNAYRCSLDVWGSKGSIFASRIFTAPDGFEPTLSITTADGTVEEKQMADDTFMKSIGFFHECIADDNIRESSYRQIVRQGALIEEFARTSRAVSDLPSCL